MVKIQRIKGGVSSFVQTVAPQGNVTAFTPDEDKAGTFTPAVADKVAAFYDNRPGVGRYVFRNEDGSKARPSVEGPEAAVAPAAAVPDVVSKQFADLEREYAKLQTDNAALKEENKRLADQCEQLKADVAAKPEPPKTKAEAKAEAKEEAREAKVEAKHHKKGE